MILVTTASGRTLDISNFSVHETILFCEECDFQTYEHLAMAPICPDCGAHLTVAEIEEEDLE